jgi:hypothetical protein
MCAIAQIVLMVLAVTRGWGKEALIMFLIGLVINLMYPDAINEFGEFSFWLQMLWALAWIGFLLYAVIHPKRKTN